MAYSGPVTDPFRRKAPDGRTYFDILNPPKGIVQVYQLTYADIAQRQRYAITPGISSIEKAYWESTALRLSRAITQFEERLAALAIRTAAVADASIRRHIDQTQVRADTSKQRHMRDNIRSRHVPLPGVAEAGVVGIADMSELNKTARGGGAYWDAQEFGTDAHVGRTVRGYFMPGRARPSQADFRVHPEFQAAGRGPQMTIAKPIEERGFLRDGIEDAWNYRHRQFASIKAKLLAEITAVARTGKPRTPQPLPTSRTQRRRR
jgi:hypothetical protein